MNGDSSAIRQHCIWVSPSNADNRHWRGEMGLAMAKERLSQQRYPDRDCLIEREKVSP